MTEFLAGQFDIAVIGAGHAGIEAALAAARLGLETIVFTINLDAVGNMPCNPAIGGTGKGHLVRELDALGGEMAKAADACCIQYRLLNLRKGPAVWSLRAQADRRKYQERMKHTLERQEHLTVRQGQVVEVRTDRGAVSQVVLATGAVYDVRAAVLATGTYLKGRTIIGTCVEDSGPDGMHAANALTESLKDTIARVIPYFEQEIRPRIEAGERVVIAAHGNSLRALVKYFENLSEEEIVGVNIPTAVPLVYEFAPDFTVVHKEYLGDPAVIAAKMQSVANQGKAGK